MGQILGIFFHALGGLAAASFYLPNRKIRQWSWETYWLAQGTASWIIMPILVCLLTVPELGQVLRNSPPTSMGWSYFFGVLWGVGGLTFGLSMRYLGLSLGYAMALGFCAAFGTIVPPIYAGNAVVLFTTASGLAAVIGVAVCLAGIATCGYAGILKEKQLTGEQQSRAIKEFALTKGIIVAVFAGLMSACFAFALQAGKPIADAALAEGTAALWQNNPVFIFAMGGGFTTNCIWCLVLNVKNNSLKEYISGRGNWRLLPVNYIWAALGGTTWYFQFFFYGMGASQLGRRYDYASWTIHMAFIIVFSNFWGLLLREWQGTSRKIISTILLGILILIFSTIIIGYGSYLKQS